MSIRKLWEFHYLIPKSRRFVRAVQCCSYVYLLRLSLDYHVTHVQLPFQVLCRDYHLVLN